MLQEARWVGSTSNHWETAIDLGLFRSITLRHWTGTSNQRGKTENHRWYQKMPRSAAAKELQRDRGERFVAKGFQFVTCQQYENECSWIVASFVPHIFGSRIGTICGGCASSIYGGCALSIPCVPPLSFWLSSSWMTPARSIICCAPSCIPLTRRLNFSPGVFSTVNLAGIYLVRGTIEIVPWWMGGGLLQTL